RFLFPFPLFVSSCCRQVFAVHGQNCLTSWSIRQNPAISVLACLACSLQRSDRRPRNGVSEVAIYNERILLITGIIERYIMEHPLAADTPEGIRSWWIASQCQASLKDVQMALDHLVESRCLSRVTLIDGTVIYAHAAQPH